MRSAPLFQLVMIPSSVLLMMASAADSMTAANQYGARSGLRSRAAHSSAERSGVGVWGSSSCILEPSVGAKSTSTLRECAAGRIIQPRRGQFKNGPPKRPAWDLTAARFEVRKASAEDF